METQERGQILGGMAGLVAGLSPMRSFTFLLALGVAAVAGWFWLNQPGDPRPPFPTYGLVAVSFAGGFLIGRVVRTVVKAVAIVAVVVLTGLTTLNYARVDTAEVEETVEASAAWVQERTAQAKDYLTGLLPSGGGAGAGMFLGGGRRRRDSAVKPD